MLNDEFSFTFYKNDEKISENTYKNLEKSKNIFRFSLFNYDTLIDLNFQKFTRENEDYIFNLDFSNKTCQIYLKKENLNLPILVDYCEINEDKKHIILEYSIETEDARIKMEIKTGEEK